MGTIKTTIQSTLQTKFESNLNDLIKQAQTLQKAFNGISVPGKLIDSLKDVNLSLGNLVQTLEKDPTSNTEFKGLATQLQQAKNQINSFAKTYTSLKNSGSLVDILLKDAQSSKTTLEEIFDPADSKIKSIIEKIDALGKKAPAAFQRIKDSLNSGDLKQIIESFQNLGTQVGNGKLIGGQYADIINSIKELIGGEYNKDNLSSFFKNIEEQIQTLEAEIDRLKQGIVQFADGTDAESKIVRLKEETTKFTNEVNKTGRALADSAIEAQRFTERLKQFFSLTNGFLLLRKAIQQAKAAVEELDQSITAIAVVSDFSVGELWDTLPQFTKRAAELGGTISDLYQGTQLWVEQGLEMDVSLRMATEAMKMARVAGISAKEATDALTSAIRGFNMEINEMSAQRVSDVYSELAKITAADTDEISTAMTKVASLASSANMEFENTAAFLSQIIETTRESAETAGTALLYSA